MQLPRPLLPGMPNEQRRIRNFLDSADIDPECPAQPGSCSVIANGEQTAIVLQGIFDGSSQGIAMVIRLSRPGAVGQTVKDDRAFDVVPQFQREIESHPRMTMGRRADERDRSTDDQAIDFPAQLDEARAKFLPRSGNRVIIPRFVLELHAPTKVLVNRPLQAANQGPVSDIGALVIRQVKNAQRPGRFEHPVDSLTPILPSTQLPPDAGRGVSQISLVKARSDSR